MQKILIIQTAFIGDVILATSLIENIHKAHPKTEIDFLLRKGNEQLLKAHPFISEILIWDKKESKYYELFNLIKKIRCSKYDKVINLQRYASTGILTALSQAKEKIGFDKNPVSFLFSKKIKHSIGNSLHEIDRNFALVSDFINDKVERPKLYPSPSDFQLIEKYKTKEYITISPTSVWFTKQYPAERWIDLINKIPNNYTIYLLGAPGDASVCETIRKKAKNTNCKVLAGQLSLLQSSALMKNATINYVNDSAPMHLCSATNANVCVVFCSTIPEFGFGPLSDKSIIVQTNKKLNCRPCGLHGFKTCETQNFDCANSIKTTELISAIDFLS